MRLIPVLSWHCVQYRRFEVKGNDIVNTRTRQKNKAILRRENPAYFATIRENGKTRVRFVEKDERDYYKAIYEGNIEFWDVEAR